MSTLADEKINSIARTFQPLNASAEGAIPTRIEILKAGSWPASSVKGPIVITVDDLMEMKANFDAGIGMAGGAGFGLPIDFMHNEWDKAGGWIKELEVEGQTLFAIVEWSKAGEDSVKNKEFKCISPSFYPACLGMWSDPEDADITARNVLVGAGLTNIPFFKDLKPIMASRENDSEEKNIIYVKETKKETPMELETVRVIDADKLTEEQKNFLAENKEQLTADERTKFGFEQAVVDASKNTEEKKEEPKVDASAPKVEGMVQVEASRLASLEASAKSYEQDKASTIVDSHIARGAIKADTKETWVKRLVEADSSTRELFEKTLADLPANEALKSKAGTEASVEASAIDQVREKAKAKIEASKAKGEELNMGVALVEVLKENKELAEAYSKEGGAQ
jgi:hypothetical protein